MISARDASSSKNESQEEIYHVLGDVERVKNSFSVHFQVCSSAQRHTWHMWVVTQAVS